MKAARDPAWAPRGPGARAPTALVGRLGGIVVMPKGRHTRQRFPRPRGRGTVGHDDRPCREGPATRLGTPTARWHLRPRLPVDHGARRSRMPQAGKDGRHRRGTPDGLPVTRATRPAPPRSAQEADHWPGRLPCATRVAHHGDGRLDRAGGLGAARRGGRRPRRPAAPSAARLRSGGRARDGARLPSRCPASRAINGQWGARPRRRQRGPPAAPESRPTERARAPKRCRCGPGGGAQSAGRSRPGLELRRPAALSRRHAARGFGPSARGPSRPPRGAHRASPADGQAHAWRVAAVDSRCWSAPDARWIVAGRAPLCGCDEAGVPPGASPWIPALTLVWRSDTMACWPSWGRRPHRGAGRMAIGHPREPSRSRPPRRPACVWSPSVRSTRRG
jgi:hypothetical protein